jgi:hypothetical protein
MAVLLAEADPAVALQFAQKAVLAQAEECALRVFEGIERLKLPRSVSPQRWQTLRKEMEASAHVLKLF